MFPEHNIDFEKLIALTNENKGLLEEFVRQGFITGEYVKHLERKYFKEWCRSLRERHIGECRLLNIKRKNKLDELYEHFCGLMKSLEFFSRCEKIVDNSEKLNEGIRMIHKTMILVDEGINGET